MGLRSSVFHALFLLLRQNIKNTDGPLNSALGTEMVPQKRPCFELQVVHRQPSVKEDRDRSTQRRTFCPPLVKEI